MTSRLIAIIAVRILALYLILTGLSVFPAFTTIEFPGFFLLDPQYLTIILGILTWVLAKPIANRIIDNETSIAKRPKLQFSKQEIEVIIFTIVGLLLLAYGIPQLVSLIVYRKSVAPLATDPLIQIEAVAAFKSSLIYNIIRIIIGAYLLCLPNHFAAILEKMRSKIVNLSRKPKTSPMN